VGAACSAIANLSHNLAEVTGNGVLHRKGTAPADRGLVPIPGSRGTLSFLVEPLAATRPETLASLAHGAGRKFDRASMHGRIRTGKSDRARLARNPFGSRRSDEASVDHSKPVQRDLRLNGRRENGANPVVVFLRNRIEFMVVAPRATRRHAHEHRGRGIDAVHDVFDLVLLGNDAALGIHAVVAVESGGNLLVEGGVWQPVRVEFADIRPNPYFQPPDAQTGSAIDVSEVKAIGFAPQDQTSGRLSVSRIVVTK
jgi:hypothetical protein